MFGGAGGRSFSRDEAVEAIRAVSRLASEAAAFKRAADSAEPLPSFNVGDSVAAFMPHSSGGRKPVFRFPYRVTAKGVDEDGAPTGFYELREILSGSTKEKDRLDAPTTRHASHIRPYALGEVMAADLLESELPKGLYFVREVLDGPRDNGDFLVEFESGVKQWLPASELRTQHGKNVYLKEYLEREKQRRRMGGAARDGTVARKTAPSASSSSAAAAAAAAAAATATESAPAAAAATAASAATSSAGESAARSGKRARPLEHSSTAAPTTAAALDTFHSGRPSRSVTAAARR